MYIFISMCMYAVTAQMDRVHHVSNLYFIPEQAQLAKWLVASSCANKAFFCNSGNYLLHPYVYTYMRTHACVKSLNVRMYVCMYVCMYMHTYKFMKARKRMKQPLSLPVSMDTRN